MGNDEIPNKMHVRVCSKCGRFYYKDVTVCPSSNCNGFMIDTGVPTNEIEERFGTDETFFLWAYKEILKPYRESHGIPTCPNCHSGNIEPIKTSAKMLGGLAFGIMSSNVRNQFKCNDCGYKW